MGNDKHSPIPTLLGKVISLSVRDRIAITSFLPERGNTADLIVARLLGNKIRLTKEEVQTIKMRNVAGPDGRPMIAWADNVIPEVEFKLTQQEFALLKGQIEKKERDGEIMSDQLDTVLKILGKEPIPPAEDAEIEPPPAEPAGKVEDI